MIELARQYGRYGYRRIAALLRDAGWQVSDDRIERLWRRGGLKVPAKQPKKGRLWLNDGSCIRLLPAYRIMARVGRPQERSIVLNDVEREELERISRLHSVPHSLMRRVQIILASVDGESNVAIAAWHDVSHPTVCHWRKKWFEHGHVGLYGEA